MLTKQNHQIDNVLNFDIPDSILEERITGRWVHLPSGRSYHTKFVPPKVPGKDDVRLIFYYLQDFLYPNPYWHVSLLFRHSLHPICLLWNEMYTIS